jgi:Cu/Ag efflux pump CusA
MQPNATVLLTRRTRRETERGREHTYRSGSCGPYESQPGAFRQLLTVLAIAASLVLFILVVEFRSFTPALLISASLHICMATPPRRSI